MAKKTQDVIDHLQDKLTAMQIDHQVNIKTFKSNKIVQAMLCNRAEYNAFQGWTTPVDENPTDEGMIVIYNNGTEDMHISWCPLDIFNQGNDLIATNGSIEPSEADIATEAMINEKGLNAPRVALSGMHQKITSFEIVKHVTPSGGILRWCVLYMQNGFSVTGKPSACVSAENDNAEVGEKIARENALGEVWALEGYLMKEAIYVEGCKGSVAKENSHD